jgi:hypothetical protein
LRRYGHRSHDRGRRGRARHPAEGFARPRCEEPHGRSPGGDVKHVDGNQRISLNNRPRGRSCIQLDRRLEVRQASRFAVRSYTPQGPAISIGGLPDQMGQGGREVDRVLSRPACYLQYRAVLWKHPSEYRQDRVSITRNGRRGQRAGRDRVTHVSWT